LLIQQNDGSGGFDRPWADYKRGFGQPSGNYWLGNDQLSRLTASGRYKLRLEVQSNSGRRYYAEYSTFRVASAADDYRLRIGGFTGTLYADVLGRHDGMTFTTLDRDHDHSSYNCADNGHGAFWYRSCAECYVNAQEWRRAGHRLLDSRGDFWCVGPSVSMPLKSTRMWIKCK